MILTYYSREWRIVYKLSSRKEDLLHLFDFVRHFSTILSLLIMFNTGIWKKREFLNLLQLVTPQVRKLPTKGAYSIQSAILLIAFYTLYFITDPILLDHGFYFTAHRTVKFWLENISESGFVSNNTVLEILELLDSKKNGNAGIPLSFTVFFLWLRFFVTFWVFTSFTFFYTHFLRNNIRNFRKNLEAISREKFMSSNIDVCFNASSFTHLHIFKL